MDRYNENRYDTDTDKYENDNRDEHKGNRWLPLLLLPLFFIGGWMAKDMIDGNNDQNTSAQDNRFGVGGGPNESTYPSISPGFENNQFDAATE
jgi:hypothetical protein